MEDIISLITTLITTLARSLTEPPGSTGAIFALAGMVLQLWVRAEWPAGEVNQGSPKVVDLPALVLTVLTVLAVGIVAGILYEPNFPVCEMCAVTKQPAVDAAEQAQDIKNIISFVAFGYVAADLRPMIKKLVDLVKKLLKFIAELPDKLMGVR